MRLLWALMRMYLQAMANLFESPYNKKKKRETKNE